MVLIVVAVHAVSADGDTSWGCASRQIAHFVGIVAIFTEVCGICLWALSPPYHRVTSRTVRSMPMLSQFVGGELDEVVRPRMDQRSSPSRTESTPDPAILYLDPRPCRAGLQLLNILQSADAHVGFLDVDPVDPGGIPFCTNAVAAHASLRVHTAKQKACGHEITIRQRDAAMCTTRCGSVGRSMPG